MDIIIIVVLLILGIGLLLLETFFIPGFGLPGIAGFGFFSGGIYYAYSTLGSTGGNVVLFIALLFSAASFVVLIKSNALDKLALKTNIESTVSDEVHSKIVVGDRGITLSRLNPIGKVLINNETLEAKSDVGFLDENTPIEVISIHSTNISVKSIS
ncbi:MAG: NfeD family protein [Bacteroidales bacterium]|nr:NfeD family protein [Bacteroidales bacterium]